MMTCFTSISAFGGRPACPFFAEEQVDAVLQLEHSLLHSSSACFFFVSFFAMGYLKMKNSALYSHKVMLTRQ